MRAKSIKLPSVIGGMKKEAKCAVHALKCVKLTSSNSMENTVISSSRRRIISFIFFCFHGIGACFLPTASNSNMSQCLFIAAMCEFYPIGGCHNPLRALINLLIDFNLCRWLCSSTRNRRFVQEYLHSELNDVYCRSKQIEHF